uniref:Uncharacterized protein n=1 Tax=Anguilla anguilla TaxID=7936 RepID=A0A0E9SX05_ANGAN
MINYTHSSKYPNHNINQHVLKLYTFKMYLSGFTCERTFFFNSI